MKKTILRIIFYVILAILAYLSAFTNQTTRIVISVLFGLPSFILMIVSRRQLGKSFAIMPKAKKLVSHGLYSRIQHPMYFFLDIFLLSIVIILNVPLLIILWAFLVLIQTLQSRNEEKVLSETFGPEYKEYEKRTWI